jgi:DNA-binding MarR family transcriptional regulator
MPHAKKLSFDTTLMVRDCCLCLHTQRAARNLARIFDDALRPLDLTNGQFSLLMSLNRPSPPAMKEVSSLLAMDRTTLTAALKPLERRGLVAIEQDQEDKRGRRLRLTSDGHRMLAKAFPIWQQTHADIERSFAQGELDRLRGQLIRLSAFDAGQSTS